MAHSYSWIAGSGLWSDPDDWNDLTVLQDPALVPPGAADAANFVSAGFPGFDLVAGPGAAKTLNYSGGLALYGSFQFGSISSISNPDNSDTLDLMPGSGVVVGTLSTGNVAVLGASLSAGFVSINDVLTVSDHAMLQSATLLAGFGGAQAVGIFDVAASSTVIASSSLHLQATTTLLPSGVVEIGNAGGAAAGVLTVDAGATATLDGLVNGPIVDNGNINGAAVFYPAAISGSGTLAAGNATFFGTIGAGITLAIAGSNATVRLPLAGVAALITGFGPAANNGTVEGPAIELPGASVLTASYAASGTGDGTLSLRDAGGNTVDQLHLGGSFDGLSFVVLPVLSGAAVGITSEKVELTRNVIAGGTTGDVTWAGVALLTGTQVAGTLSLGNASSYPEYGTPSGPSTLDLLPGASLAPADLDLDGELIAVGASITVASTIALGSIAESSYGISHHDYFNYQGQVVLRAGASG